MSSTLTTTVCLSGILSCSSAFGGTQVLQPQQQVSCIVGTRSRPGLLVVRAVSLPVEDGGSLGFVVASGGAIAALAIALADPQKRRENDARAVGGNETESIKNYFNTQGFERWRKIYGETDDVNKVQLDIRVGHAQTVDKTLAFLKGGDGLKGVTVCDAGCGTGSLTIPLCEEGAIVSASDISSAMVAEADRKVAEVLDKNSQLTKPVFQAQDLESITGKYHTVVCLDVLIHYPQGKAASMIAHLASCAEERLLLSFAPKTPYYTILKRIGELFPGPSKATRAYLHAEEDVEQALNAIGWKVTRRDMTATKFYFSRLLEAVPVNSSIAIQ